MHSDIYCTCGVCVVVVVVVVVVMVAVVCHLYSDKTLYVLVVLILVSCQCLLYDEVVMLYFGPSEYVHYQHNYVHYRMLSV